MSSPYLTTDEAAEYLRFTGKHRLRSVYRFLKLKGVPTQRRGTMSLLILRTDLERALQGNHRLTLKQKGAA
jgi:hypothetical protein